MPLAGRLAALYGAFALAIAAAPAAAQSLSAADREKIGLAALIDRLGAAAPDGSGVLVSQVEAPLTLNGSDYRPDPTYFPGDTIVAKNGGTYSTHALGVGLGWYGSGGVAPGVSNVEVWNANSWQLNVLRLGSRFAPTTDTRKVANFSWYGNFADTDDALNAIARLDLVAERDKVVIVTAVNNGAGTAVPQFPASLYNGITVGLSSGASSKGPTTLAPGRSKPDLVAPASSTSIGAAWVSGAAAILVEAASGNAHALEPTTIKALLMAGATKTEFDLTDATPSTSDDWSHTPTQPLDARYGAGELNIDNSHRIFAAGEQAASDTVGVGLAGWDFGAASPSNLQQYILTIPEGRVAQTVSVIAAWERHIDFTQGPPGGEATLTPSLANLDLTLTRLSGPGAGATLAQSLSTVDNVEHLFLDGPSNGSQYLTPGQYAIRVSTDQAWDYSIAWDVLLATPGDGNGDGLVDGADYTLWADHFLQTGATFGQGDYNADGIVDGADYTIWADNFSPGVSLALAIVPEPSGIALLATGCAAAAIAATTLWLVRRRQPSR